MNILITGSNGFIGSSLKNFLIKESNIKIFDFNREDKIDTLHEYISKSNFIFHLAGVNRSNYKEDFQISNVNLTNEIAKFLLRMSIKIPVYYSSTIHTNLNTEYGITKLQAEKILFSLSQENGNKVIVDKLVGVYGPGAKPNYNSVVSTFCHNISKGLQCEISDPTKILDLIFIDDLIKKIYKYLIDVNNNESYIINKISVCDLYEIINSFRQNNLIKKDIDKYFYEKLFATYIYYASI